MSDDIEPPVVGERLVLTLYRRGPAGLEPFDAPGTVSSIVPSKEPPHLPVLIYVLMDERGQGERAIGMATLREARRR